MRRAIGEAARADFGHPVVFSAVARKTVVRAAARKQVVSAR